jgi:hypothetical protein
MPEPFFGSSAPLWPTIPFLPFGHQAPLAGHRGMTFGVSGPVQSEPYALNTGLLTAAPFFGSPEIPSGITPAALIAAVAIRRGQPLGPTNDQELEDFIYDALDLLPGASDIEVRCEGGRVTLTGAVQQKRLKRDVGEIAWAIPPVNDVQNNITITARRRSRAQSRETEPPTVVAGRKHA